MQKIVVAFLFPFLLFISFSIFAGDEGASVLIGTWGGAASYSGSETPFAFRFQKNDKGDIIASFDMPETNVMNATVGKVVSGGNGFRVWKFTFQRDEAQNTITGVYSFGGRDIHFHLKKDAAIAPPSTLGPAKKIGTPVWTFDAKAALWSSPAAADGAVYFGSNDGTLYALNANSGKPRWQFKTGRAILARPTVDHGSLYVTSDDGYLYKLVLESGNLIWRFDTGGGRVERGLPDGKDPRYDYFASSATIVDGFVFIGSANGKMFALDEKTGIQKWEFQTRDIVRSTPAVAEGLVIFGSRDHWIYALAQQTGELRWKFDTGDTVVSSPVYSDGTIYIGSRSSDVFAIEAASGKLRWRYFYWLSWVESSGTIRDRTLYIGSSDYQLLFALNTKTGRPIWSFDTDGSAWSTPAVTKDTVFIGAVGTVGYMADHRGGFFAVNRSNGKERWRFTMDPIPASFAYGTVSSPVIYEDRVYFGSIDGKFYAFKTGG